MPTDEAQRELLGRLLAVQQQVIDLRARLDREHQAGDGFRRFSERALDIETVEDFWALAAEEVVSTFGSENALIVHVADDCLELCGAACVYDVDATHLATLAPTVTQALAAREVVLVGRPLPPFVGAETAVLLVAGFRDRDDGDHTYAILASVSTAKAPFYPTFDAAIGPLYAAFVNHAGALHQHIRARERSRHTARQLKRLADVASRTSNAVVITDRECRIEWVNDGFVRLTGYTLDEVVGKGPGTFLHGPGTEEAVRRMMREAVAAYLPFDVEVCNYAKSGRQYFVQIESRVTYDDDGHPNGFIAIETDITERRVAARRDGLAQKIAGLLLASPSLETAGVRVVEEIVAALDVPVAQMWLVAPRKSTLDYLAGAATTGNDAAAAFCAVSRALDFHADVQLRQNVGLPGLAWGTGRVAFYRDLEHLGPDDIVSRRLSAAHEAGIRTICAVPVLGPTGVLGVLEVGSPAGHPINEIVASILERVAEQMAAFLLNDASRRAFQTIFEQSPDALLLIDADGRIDAANARALMLFGNTVDRVVDDLLEEGRALVSNALGPIEHGRSEAVLLHRDAHGAGGTAFSAEVSVAPARTTDGSAVIIAVRDLTERHRMEAALTHSLREKETLLKEIHHRVKNNLQIISSMLMLQVDQMPSPEGRALLEESVHRVRSMALVHQQLYGADSLERIDLSAYARQLTEALRSALAPRARVRVEAVPVDVTVEHAVPFGLIINELFTNALKYGMRGIDPAAAAARDVDVEIALKVTDGVLDLSVRDFGAGLPVDFDINRATTLGLQLVRSLTRQLRGKLEFKSDGGARFSVRWKLPSSMSTSAAPAS